MQQSEEKIDRSVLAVEEITNEQDYLKLHPFEHEGLHRQK